MTDIQDIVFNLEDDWHAIWPHSSINVKSSPYICIKYRKAIAADLTVVTLDRLNNTHKQPADYQIERLNEIESCFNIPIINVFIDKGWIASPRMFPSRWVLEQD